MSVKTGMNGFSTKTTADTNTVLNYPHLGVMREMWSALTPLWFEQLARRLDQNLGGFAKQNNKCK